MTKPTLYKPRVTSEFIGKTQRIARIVFKNARELGPDDCAKWLFYGDPGSGKSELAMSVSAMLANESLVTVLNGQSVNVDLVRNWMSSNHYRPLHGMRTVIVINEVDAASPAAFAQLRSFLDEMKNGTVFIATTNKMPSQLEPQFQTRLKPYRFEKVAVEELSNWLTSKWGLSVEDGRKVANESNGCVRSALIDAEAILELKELEETK